MSTFAWVIVGGLLMAAIAMVGSVTTILPAGALDRLLLPLVSLAAGTLLGSGPITCCPGSAPEETAP